MAVVHLPKIASPLHGSPTLPHSEFKTHAIIRPLRPPHTRTHNAKYSTALEAEHSRDLYLQGAMAVGQIARLLKELCADIYDGDVDDADDNDDNEEDGAAETVAVDELSARQPPSDPMVIHQLLSHEKRAQIAAWARAVSLANDICINRGLTEPRYDADVIDLEDVDATYLRGAFIVGDIADLLDNLIRGFDDEVDEAQEEDDDEKEGDTAFSPDRVALAQLPVKLSSSSRNPDEISDANFASRLSCLSARLDKLEGGINTFSQDRTDALKQMELDDELAAAAQDSDKVYWSGCDEIVESVDSCHRYIDQGDALGIRDIFESEASLLLSRVWTVTETTTSGFSLVTPSGSDIRTVNFESHSKDYFWTLD